MNKYNGNVDTPFLLGEYINLSIVPKFSYVYGPYPSLSGKTVENSFDLLGEGWI
jgi:hypothetical protein